ncbi:radical SAM protein [Mesorhizobium australicum]|uniref:B12-binding domain-containing radical SAM protein n=1 Tax=Mesorhizobium australicum TaxID=536018 RepID=UPI00333D0A23
MSPDVLLVSPPVGNFAQVHPAICLLTAYLRSKGVMATQRDLAIECFHHYHSAEYLLALRDKVRSSAELDGRLDGLTQSQAKNLAIQVRLTLLLDRVGRLIGSVIEELRDPAILDRPVRLARALRTLKDAGRAITAAHPGQHFSFQEFRVEKGFDSWENLERAVTTPEANLLLDFVNLTGLPDAKLLGLSVTYPDQLLPALCIARKWREMFPLRSIVFGGSYMTRMAQSFTSERRWFDFFDYLVVGDGEDALLSLAQLGGNGTADELAKIPNLHFVANGSVQKSHRVARTKLDDLPIPMLEFDGIDHSSYVAPHPIVALPISKGCYWGKCTFCNISNQAEEPYRFRAVQNVIADIEALSAVVGTRYFDFCIDAYHPKGLAELATAISKAKLSIFWNAEVLLDRNFDAARLAQMAESGCKHLRFGLESVNEGTLAVMNKRNDLEVVKRILGDCYDLDIKVSLMSIIGFPTESEADAWHTIKFYLENAEKISFVTLHKFNVSAGSPLMYNPTLANIDLIAEPGLLQPRFSYRNRNREGIPPDRTAAVVRQMENSIKDRYPQHAEIHTVGIGGWLTFLACCRQRVSFFKQPVAIPRLSRALESASSLRERSVHFTFDLAAVESVARGVKASHYESSGSRAALSEDDSKVFVLRSSEEHMVEKPED